MENKGKKYNLWCWGRSWVVESESCAGDGSSKQLFSMSQFWSSTVFQSSLRILHTEDFHFTRTPTEKLNLGIRCNSAASLLEYLSLAWKFQLSEISHLLEVNANEALSPLRSLEWQLILLYGEISWLTDLVGEKVQQKKKKGKTKN